MTFCCLAISACRWHITTGCTRGHSPCRISQELYVAAPRSTAPTCGSVNRGGSPDPGCSSVGDSADVVGASSRPSRRAFARRRPTRVRETPRRIAPRLTVQDPLAAAGAMVFDCRGQ